MQNLCRVIGQSAELVTFTARDATRFVLSLVARPEVLQFIPEIHPRKIFLIYSIITIVNKVVAANATIDKQHARL